MTRGALRLVFRLWRRLKGRDFCEQCDGTRGVRGNENRVRGAVVCDACVFETIRGSKPR